jgi:hypothetical protein
MVALNGYTILLCICVIFLHTHISIIYTILYVLKKGDGVVVEV